jgi:hypothetical protein
MAKIAIHVHHEAFSSPSEGKIPQGLDYQVCPMATQWTSIINGAQESLIYFVTHFPTLKHVHPMHSKTQQFFNLIEKKN